MWTLRSEWFTLWQESGEFVWKEAGWHHWHHGEATTKHFSVDCIHSDHRPSIHSDKRCLWFRLIPYFKLAQDVCLCQADKDSGDLRVSKMVWQLPKVGWSLILMREGRSDIEIEIEIEGGQKLKWPQLRTFSASSPVSLRPFFAPRSVQMSALAEELSSDWPKVLNLSQPYICRNFLGIRPPVIHKMGNWKGVAWEWQPWT